MTEHIHDGQDGLDVPGCHHAMVMKLTADLPTPLLD